MAKDWFLNQESFDALLNWLDFNREVAGQKYEIIRRGLIKFFEKRGCQDPEDLTDAVINRVAGKIKEISQEYHSDPVLYFYGVAKKIYLEDKRKKPAVALDPSLSFVPAFDELFEDSSLSKGCLKKCLARLSDEDRQIVSAYYASEERVAARHRQKVAEQFNLETNTLRVKAFRIRNHLRKCVFNCLWKKEKK